MLDDNQINDVDQMSRWQAIWDSIAPKPEVRDVEPETPNYDMPEIINDHTIDASKEMSFADIYHLAQSVDSIFDKKRLNENAELADVAKKVAASPNPIYPYTAGKDSDLNASLASNKVLRDISDLKVKLEALEREVHASDVKNDANSEKRLNKEVDSIRDKIEALCQKLTPNPLTDR